MLPELGRTRMYPTEDLKAFVKSFQKRTLDYYDPVAEEGLVDVCLHGMIKEYRLHLENLCFMSFSVAESCNKD